MGLHGAISITRRESSAYLTLLPVVPTPAFLAVSVEVEASSHAIPALAVRLLPNLWAKDHM